MSGMMNELVNEENLTSALFFSKVAKNSPKIKNNNLRQRLKVDCPSPVP